MRILLVEDDKSLAKIIAKLLYDLHNIDLVYTGSKAIYLAETVDYDLIILDLNLPDISGIKILKTLRTECINTPVLILTDICQLNTKLKSFKLGADDYLTKPFEIEELKARIAALTRKQTSQKQEVFQTQNLQLNSTQKQVTYADKNINLSRREYQLLKFLMLNQGKTLSSSFIYEHVWESTYHNASNTVAVHIRRLRKKLDQRFKIKLITTVHGHGYKLET